MKLEKREITLNEYDSILDAAYKTKALLTEYVFALSCVKRKETRSEILKCLKETGEDMCFLFDLLEKKQ